MRDFFNSLLKLATLAHPLARHAQACHCLAGMERREGMKMSGRNGNFWAQSAALLTRIAHMRQPHVKWLSFVGLAGLWLIFGLLSWYGRNLPPGDALYLTLGALTVQDAYKDAAANQDLYGQIARFAGIFVPLVGILFAFSGQLGRGLASLYMTFAARHIVIAGQSPAALALAQSCVNAGDAVALIAPDLAPETAWSLRQSGVVLYEGDGADLAILKSARVRHADHMVALTGEDTANLKIEAAVRAACAGKSRKRPLAAHVAIESPMLLIEAREMRVMLQRERDQKAKEAKEAKRQPPPADPIDPRPFALDELAARTLLTQEAAVLLDLAEAQGQTHPHIVVFGSERSGEAVAVRALMSLWSVHFGEPRITIVTPDPVAADASFAARYPQAVSHDVWKADIAFIQFDWRQRALDLETLNFIVTERGAPTAVVVACGVEAESIQLALGLMRTANIAAQWPVPIYLKLQNRSEFSQQFASGDRTPGVPDAYLQAFGTVEDVAARELIIDGRLDRGAAVAHRVYQMDIAAREDLPAKSLEAVGRGWDSVGETYRAANRAVADAALVKMWDFGWRVAGKRERGITDPTLDESLFMRMAEVEHRRWNAERLLSGWRPGPTRNNAMMVHNNLVSWRQLSDGDRQKDVVQVKAAVKVARILHPQGFARDPRRLA
jgi:hypothetical protein